MQQSASARNNRMAVSSSHIFAVALAVTLFVSADALFPLLVSGGQEIDIDTAATARVRTLGWMAVYLLSFVCLAISWRGAIEAIRQNLVFVLLIALAIFSAMWSDNPLRAAYSASQLGVLTLFALTVSYRLPHSQALVVACFSYAMMIGLSVALIAIRPDLGISSSIMYEGAWRGIFIHKNHFGTQLSFAFVTFFSVFILFTGWVRWAGAALLLVTLFLCFKSRSSTAVITCLAVPLIYLALHAAKTSRSMLYGIIGATFTGASIMVAILAGGWKAIMELLGKDPELSGRGSLWSMIFDSIETHPFLGFGYDSYWSSPAVGGGGAITRSVVWSPGGAHNGWIELTTQLGFIGLALWAVVFLRTAGLATRLSLGRNQGGNPGALWPALMLIVVTTWSLVESNIMRHGNSVHFVFALMTGYLLHLDTGTAKRQRNEANGVRSEGAWDTVSSRS